MSFSKSKINSQYVVVAEFEKQGYILGILNTQKEAEKLADQVWVWYGLSKEKITAFFEKKISYVCKYRIYGNYEMINKGLAIKLDGQLATHVIEFEGQIFCLKSFIKERENFSTALDGNTDDKMDKMFELFPSFSVNAN